MKDRIEIIQSIVTIFAIIIGGIWSYNIFVKERRNYPHASIYQDIQHFQLNKKINLVKIELKVENSGTSLLVLKKTKQFLQQVLPLLPCSDGERCSTRQINNALAKLHRSEPRFSWEVISILDTDLQDEVDIEPGEHENIDFEFVIPSNIKLIRVYSYFRNEHKSSISNEVGWSKSSFYYMNTKKEKSNE